MNYIVHCPRCDTERPTLTPLSESLVCPHCGLWEVCRTPGTKHMSKPVLMVKFSDLCGGWQVLFNYNPKDAVPAYIAYVDKCYPNEWGTKFKIVDLENQDDKVGCP